MKELRKPLVEVIKLQVPISWSTTGRKIVGVLSRRDHMLSQALRQYEQGPDSTQDTAIYLQDMFSAIEVECDNLARLGGKVADDSTWHANSVQTRAGPDFSKLCRYGAKCKNKKCGFQHPQDRPEKRILDTSNSQGGHGLGRSKPTCTAKDCQEKTYKGKRFCTTCFMNGQKTGRIQLKDGSVFKIKSVKRSNESTNQNKKDSKTIYRFTAEQLQGLKIMNTAQLSAAEEEAPAPASIKRQRVHERLGQMYKDRISEANSAHTYNNKQNIQLFLNELYGDSN